MNQKERVTQVVFQAIDEVNQLRSGDEQIRKSAETILSGEAGGLDSLGLINLIVAAEQGIEETFGVSISLTDESIMSQEGEGLERVETFVDTIIVLLNEGEHEQP